MAEALVDMLEELPFTLEVKLEIEEALDDAELVTVTISD
jgi:hypothetical protein